MLHTWKSKPRHRFFRRALAMRAILRGYPFSLSCVPQFNGCSSGLSLERPTHSPHCGECVGHLFARQSSNGPRRERVPKSFRKSRSRATSRRRRRWATSLVERARPHDPGSGPCTPLKVQYLPAALDPRCSNTHQSLQPSPSAMISSSTVSSLLNVVRMLGLGPGEPVRTLSAENIVFHKCIS